MITRKTWERGLLKGIKMAGELAKVMVPAYILVTILKSTPVLQWLSNIMEPFMVWFGLPGEAAMPIVLGFFFSQYAAIGIISALDLTIKEITIVGLMLVISHDLFVEGTIAKKTGISMRAFIMIRMTIALLSGFILNWLW